MAFTIATALAEPLLTQLTPEKLWDEKVRAFGDAHGVRFGTSLTAIGNKLENNGNKGFGYDWDIYFDYKLLEKEQSTLTLGAQFEKRATRSGTDPNFNGFPNPSCPTCPWTSIFVLDGNFYDHDNDLVELWLEYQISDFSILGGRFDQGRRFAGFSYGGSFRYFFNQAFSGNSTLSLPFATATGADVTYRPNKSYYAMAGVANANAKSQHYSNFNGDLFTYAEFTLTPDQDNYHFYYWNMDGGPRDAQNGALAPRSYGYGFAGEHRLDKEWLVFSRVGFANDEGSAPSKSQVSAGAVYEQMGRFATGVGVSLNKARATTPPATNENQITSEIFVKLFLTEKISTSFGYTFIKDMFYGADDDHVYSARAQIWY